MRRREPVSIQIELSGLSIEVLTEDMFHAEVRPASHVLHEHAIHEIYCIESGEMVFECNGIHTLKAGDLFVISAGSAHRVVRYSETMRWFHFRFRMLTGALGQEMQTHYFPSYRQHEMEDLIQDIRSHSMEADSVMARYRFRVRIGILLSYVLESLTPFVEKRSTALPQKSVSKSRIIRYAQIDSFLYDNCADVVRLEDLARHLHYSKIQTARLVRECCGMPFSEKLREIRIRLAKELLTAGEMPVAEVAERCGYQTRQGFDTAFTHVVGVSPSVFRKQKDKA